MFLFVFPFYLITNRTTNHLLNLDDIGARCHDDTGIIVITSIRVNGWEFNKLPKNVPSTSCLSAKHFVTLVNVMLWFKISSEKQGKII